MVLITVMTGNVINADVAIFIGVIRALAIGTPGYSGFHTKSCLVVVIFETIETLNYFRIALLFYTGSWCVQLKHFNSLL